jgi:hemerythrin-like domain-containing protein
MIGAHNVFIRGLNSIILQGPHVPGPGSEFYSPKDLKDFLHYVGAWERLLEHHHDAEERVLFPELAKLSDAVKQLVEAPVEEHAAFHGSLVALHNYVEKCSQDLDCYRWEALNSLIKAFAPSLMDHLYSEPNMLLGLENDCSSDSVEKCMAATEKAAINDTTLDFLYTTFPIVLGTADKTYEGGNTFPPLPWLMKFSLKWWFSRRNQGAWRFCPSDWESQPRPLEFLPQME